MNQYNMGNRFEQCMPSKSISNDTPTLLEHHSCPEVSLLQFSLCDGHKGGLEHDRHSLG